MLRRLTPLRARKPMKAWRRKPEDQVKQADVAYVYARDGGRCLAPRFARQHGEPIDACWGRNTIEHVHTEPMLGKRAPSDKRHMLLLCLHHNSDGWASMHKDWERDYLARVEGADDVEDSVW